ncbi:MAG: T9SS type A sorting domain-containing protein, partial [Phycisphaerae bacterium]|nr:T9SS type A sorting domain-containing protein [Saprospiraceae bacterium]
GTDGGVFRYDGISWTDLSAGLSDTTVHKIVFAPNGDLFAGTNMGIAKWSANSWTKISNGLNGSPVHSIALDQNTAHIVIGTGYSIDQVGTLYGQLYESLDGGDSWAQIATALETTVINDLAFVGNQTWLGAGWGVFKSSDNGHTWSASNAGFSAKTFNTQGRLAVTPDPNRALFYGSDDGVFRSLDEGASWTLASKGLTRHIVTLLKADHFGNLFCGVMRYLGENSVGFGDGVLYKSTDNGDHWLPVTISKDWRYMEMSELENGDLICAHGFGAQPPSATIVGSSLARSTDHGDTWTDLDVKSGMAFCCAANVSGDLFVAGESQSVYRSTDGGNSFGLIAAPGQEGNVGTLEVSPTGDIFMGSGGQRTLYFSTDNGTNYQSFSSPVLPDYRGVSDVIFDGMGKAYCSTSGQGGMPELFTISPPFTANSTFVPLPAPAGSLFKMTWDECGYLYIYRGGSILKSILPLRLQKDECISETESLTDKKNSLEIYPNPTTGVLHIHRENTEDIRLSLWNTSGQKVRESSFSRDTELHLEALPAGIYWLKAWDASGLVQILKIVRS